MGTADHQRGFKVLSARLSRLTERHRAFSGWPRARWALVPGTLRLDTILTTHEILQKSRSSVDGCVLVLIWMMASEDQPTRHAFILIPMGTKRRSHDRRNRHFQSRRGWQSTNFNHSDNLDSLSATIESASFKGGWMHPRAVQSDGTHTPTLKWGLLQHLRLENARCFLTSIGYLLGTYFTSHHLTLQPCSRLARGICNYTPCRLAKRHISSLLLGIEPLHMYTLLGAY